MFIVRIYEFHRRNAEAVRGVLIGTLLAVVAITGVFLAPTPISLDGSTLDQQPTKTRVEFHNTWGDDAKWQWNHEHNLEVLVDFIKHPTKEDL